MIQQPLRVLHVMLHLGPTTGPYNEHCLPLIGERDLTICTYFPPTIPLPKGISLFQGDGSPWGFLKALTAALRQGGYDAMHVHGPHVGVVAALARIAAGTKRVGGLVYTVLNSYHVYKPRNRFLMALVLVFSDRVICCSEAVVASFPRFVRRLAGDRIRVVYNAVDIARVDRALDRVQPRPQDAFTVVSVGRLIATKNPLALLRAFHVSDDGKSRLVIVGDGELRATIAQEACALGIQDRVTLTGMVPRDSVYPHIAEADVLISVSRGEGLPVAVLEGMACRCPVILSDIPPHREIASAGHGVRIVPVDDVPALARAIAAVRALSPEERRRIGASCRKLVEDRFSLGAMHQQCAAIYRELRDVTPRPSPVGLR
jgi:glycosyltransferase involved in cell wall biosynthesis